VPAPRRFEPDFQFELKIGTPSWMLSFFDWPSVIAAVPAVAESDHCRLARGANWGFNRPMLRESKYCPLRNLSTSVAPLCFR